MNASTVTLSLDAMGGDHAPDIVVKGVAQAAVRYPQTHYLMFGDEARLKPLLTANPVAYKCCTIVHAPDVVSGDAKPSQALRSGKQTSMWKAIEAVKNGEAAAVVSAGNTGALMAMSKLILRMLPGIDRPALVSMLPTVRGETVLLDLGANAQCDTRNLVEFAIMGECFARAMLGLEKPVVGLLNVGSEDLKGTDTLREAAAHLRSAHLDMEFYGFVEGDDITKGTVDVVVTDGFTGNITLKTIEGTAKLYTEFLRNAVKSSIFAQFGMLFARPVISQVVARTNPRRYNGGLFVGLNGIAVKSHGGTDAVGFANAIGVAVDMVARNLNTRIAEELARMAPPAVAAVASE